MRVLFNGASAIKPKSGVGHTTANLHAALCEHFPADSFWRYPRRNDHAIRTPNGSKT